MRGCGRRGAECRDRCPRRLALGGLEGEAQQQPPPKAEENCRETGNGRSTHIRPPLPLGAVDAASRLRAGPLPPAPFLGSTGFRESSETVGSSRRTGLGGPWGGAGRGVRHFGTLSVLGVNKSRTSAGSLGYRFGSLVGSHSFAPTSSNSMGRFLSPLVM